MRWFDNLSARLKIYTAVAVAGIAAAAVGVVGLQKMSQMAEAAEYLYRDNLVPVAQLGTVKQEVQRSWLALLDSVITARQAGTADDRRIMTDADARVDEVFAAYTATDMTGREQAVEQFGAAMTDLREVRDTRLSPLAEDGDVPGFAKVRDEAGRPALIAAVAALDELVTIEMRVAADKRAETAAAYRSARTLMIVLLVSGLTVALLMAFLVVRGIMRTLDSVGRVTRALADRDLTVRAGVSGRDELGRMATELDSGTTAVAVSVDRMAQVAVTLSAAAEHLSAVSGQLQSGAEEASIRVSSASDASENVNSGVQSIAAGAEQMSASITEIASNAGQAAQVAQQGMAMAQQTARATEDITARIGAIQTSSDAAASAISEITEVIGRISDYTTTIASAVEEQTATTAEMSRSVADAATNSGDVARTVAGVADIASDTARSAQATRQAASDLTTMADDLTQLVNGFRH
jgi:methyl-accepting chemotaxis protein